MADDIRIDKLLHKVQKNQEIVDDLENRNTHVVRIEPEENSRIFSSLKTSNKFLEITNFSEKEIILLFNSIEPFFSKKRGKKPKFSDLDHFITLLIFYKTGIYSNFLIN